MRPHQASPGFFKVSKYQVVGIDGVRKRNSCFAAHEKNELCGGRAVDEKKLKTKCKRIHPPNPKKKKVFPHPKVALW
jgi:hypothetical protein